MTTTLTFDASVAEDVIKEFGREVDDDGYIVDPETGNRVETESGDQIHVDQFAGVEKGSIIFLDDDFNTLVDHMKRRQVR